jgi:hypothetical protein
MTKLLTLHMDLCYLHLFNTNYERDKAVNEYLDKMSLPNPQIM